MFHLCVSPALPTSGKDYQYHTSVIYYVVTLLMVIQ